ncbi:hypothetical protein APR12_003066 [Nocardia amikacinitolerans]|uniref:TetR/AcrR family transcriptional regulator n=1 Tax=Nocardia amikacinitolerans TaxID=756689 RepID=UPI000831230E|nr:TetR/AcrR family transcriptional regulator [Nocardia amikacinitolerans]MCP2317713.1 hypothetical protein [Nocardia amikacinitolerans]
MTLDDVAKAAGVGVGTAYRHLGKNLITEIFEHYLGRIREIAETAAQLDNPWCGLVEILEDMYELVAGNRAFMAAVTGSPEHSALFDR